VKPIIFSTDMVRAILNNRKTMTRRVVKPQPTRPHWDGIAPTGWHDGHRPMRKAPYQPGDILWVRETWRKTGIISAPFAYRADECPLTLVGEKNNILQVQYSYRPSIHMPREAARIFLRVTDVRVERLQEMPLYDVWECRCGWRGRA